VKHPLHIKYPGYFKMSLFSSLSASSVIALVLAYITLTTGSAMIDPTLNFPEASLPSEYAKSGMGMGLPSVPQSLDPSSAFGMYPPLDPSSTFGMYPPFDPSSEMYPPFDPFGPFGDYEIVCDDDLPRRRVIRKKCPAKSLAKNTQQPASGTAQPAAKPVEVKKGDAHVISETSTTTESQESTNYAMQYQNGGGAQELTSGASKLSVGLGVTATVLTTSLLWS
jgi:hypothetical protein